MGQRWIVRLVLCGGFVAKEQIVAPASPEGFASSGRAELGRTNASSPWYVIAADCQSSRLQLVSRVISDCGAFSRPFSGLAQFVPEEATDTCTLAVVALESKPAPGHPSLEVLRALKRGGFNIVAYEDGLRDWPVVVRCYPLLAGATQLLDSAQRGFPAELKSVLTHLLRSETERKTQERMVKEVMLGLGLVGDSKPMLAVFQAVLRVSTLSDLSTLLTGETGTGKECLARAIHHLDPNRKTGPFIAVNCAALTPTLAESELFGHRRGAFTGAERERKGLIRAAHGGVLFLDEIGELAEPLQAKLLRVLQDHRVCAVGEEQEIAVNVRVVAATNRSLVEMVQQGRFRADLLHRLNLISLHAPPLRERPADIPPLIQFFLKKHGSLNGSRRIAVTEGFVDALMQVELPGNVRQLESLVCQALLNKDTERALDLSDLPLEILGQLSESPATAQAPAASIASAGQAVPHSTTMSQTDGSANWEALLHANGDNLVRSLRCCERALLAKVLQRTQGNQAKAARLLGITPRSVYNKVRKYRLQHVT